MHLWCFGVQFEQHLMWVIARVLMFQQDGCQMTALSQTYGLKGQCSSKCKPYEYSRTQSRLPSEKTSAAVLMALVAVCPSALASSGATYPSGGCTPSTTLVLELCTLGYSVIHVGNQKHNATIQGQA